MALNVVVKPFLKALVILGCHFFVTACYLKTDIAGTDYASKPFVAGPLKVIRTTPDGSAPKSYAKSGNHLFFTATIPGTTSASHFTDGTTPGTLPITGLSANLPADAKFRGAIGSVLFFHSVSDGKLWRSDGTIAGTYALITTTDPDRFISSPTPMRLSASGTVGVWVKENDRTILQTDGTVAGTHETNLTFYPLEPGVTPHGIVILHENQTGPWSVDVYLFDLTTRTLTLLKSFADMDEGRGESYQDGTSKYYFPMHEWGIGNYMAVSDGTVAGTVQLQSFAMMDYVIKPVGKFGSKVVFVSQPAGSGGGYRFYSTEGTAVGDWTELANTGYTFVGPNYYMWGVDFAVQLGSKSVVRFYEADNPSDPAFCRIWVTDGTVGGTVQIGGAAIEDPATGSFGGSQLKAFAFDNAVYFQGYDAINGVELWKYDTVTAPALVADVNPGAANGLPIGGFARDWDAAVTTSYFVLAMQTAATGTEPYISDGTASGTQLLKDVSVGSRSSLGGPNGNEFLLYSLNNEVIFQADDGVNGLEFWTSNGTSSGTRLLAGLNSAPGASDMDELQVLNGKIYFTGDNGLTGVEPWVSDGTEAGTFLLADINSSSSTSYPENFVSYNGHTYFTAMRAPNLGDDATSLWKTDGTTAGTTNIADQKLLGYTPLVSYANGLAMIGYESTNGMEPWISDGTVAGTQILKNITSGSSSSFDWGADWFTSWNRKIFFAPNRGVTTNDPWVSDGTNPGTIQLAAIDNATDGGEPLDQMGTSQWLFFIAEHPTFGVELFKTDGTPGNTSVVKDIDPAGDGLYWAGGSFYGTVNDKLIFDAHDGVTGYELWVSDGSSAGTFLLKDMSPGGDTFIRASAQDANYVYLLLRPDGGNWELWRTDGTSLGTEQIHEFTNGEIPRSTKVNMAATNGLVYFTMCEATHGCELWRSDSTSAGTKIFWDATAGTIGTSPRSFVLYNGKLAFIGSYQGGGEALWITDLNAPPDE